MNNEEQLALWVAGESKCPNDRGECCPDFSCCQPELQADKDTREAFARAFRENREEDIHAFLSMFLGKSIDKAFEKLNKKPKVRIAGDPVTEH